MQDTDKIKMRIKIAGLSIPLSVAFKEQDHVRETEARVAELFDNWRRMFPTKSTEELLAMMTYQYASHYLAETRNSEKSQISSLSLKNSSTRQCSLLNKRPQLSGGLSLLRYPFRRHSRESRISTPDYY